MKDEKFRDTVSEMRIAAYMIRKNHKVCEEITQDVFSIKAYRLFYDIILTEKTTLPKDVFKDRIKDKTENSDLLSPYLAKVFSVDLDNTSKKTVKIICDKLKKLSILRQSLEMSEELLDNIQKEDIQSI